VCLLQIILGYPKVVNTSFDYFEMLKHNKLQSQSGFNLLQALIFSFICLVLVVVTGTAFVSAQRTSRDAQRVSDVQQIRLALKYYHDEFGHYPQSSPSYQAVGSDNTFSRFISNWPTPPTADGGCTAQLNNYAYDQLNSGSSYQLRFCLGRPYGNLSGGVRTASPSGFQ
jgi:hypothetical protein